VKRVLFVLLAVSALAVLGLAGSGSATASSHYTLNCARSPVCTEVQDPEEVFGEDSYVATTSHRCSSTRTSRDRGIR